MNITLNYSDKSFVVSGTTKEFKTQLMALGGKYNPHLKTGPGYVFTNDKEQQVRDFIDNPDKLPTENKDILSKSFIIKPKIKSPLQSTSSVLNYPNRFVGSDGLSYQIIILTCPLPYLNQKVTVKSSDNSFDAVVSSVNDSTNDVTNDIILTYEEDNIPKQTRAIILNGKWQIYLFDVNHELIFHP